ncbi:hypothetical protein [Bacteroides sp. 519]|uniref:hypothetical protein n=1 Tax=Bacteroides sp. 519 TaxID=2302937 RepID=UPI0013D488BA|nr:hypothetical protein [Bacteroides sp. 519]NDV57107.1 hypothetical protein [Bacteroides sp. 519]
MKMKLFLAAVAVVFSMTVVSCGGNTQKAATTETETRTEQAPCAKDSKECCKADSTECSKADSTACCKNDSTACTKEAACSKKEAKECCAEKTAE